MTQEVTNLQQVLDRIDKIAVDTDKVSFDVIVKSIGNRSFGPLLLVMGLLTLSPLSSIPGVPLFLALLVLLIAVQLFIRREHAWLPRWLLNRTVPCQKLEKSLKWLRPSARAIDKVLRPRLTVLVNSVGTTMIALVCIFIAIVVVAVQLVPFAPSGAGAVLTIFGLALTTRDGLLALIAYIGTALFGVFMISYLL